MSRLLNNSEGFRKALKTRNLYSFDNEYPNPSSNSAANAIINAVNSISSVVKPYSGYDLSNTVFGRLVGDKTPLSEIGLVMLGKQFAFTTTKRTATELIPTIKPLNVFLKGQPVIAPKVNYRITKQEDQNFFQRFLDITTFYTPAKDYIFNRNSTNLDYLRNTGDFQLDVLASQLNRNLYNNTLYLTEPVLRNRVKDRAFEIVPNKTYFTTNQEFTAYDYKFVRRDDWALDGNVGMRSSMSIDAFDFPEYARDYDFVKDYFGISDATPTRHVGDLAELNNWVDIDTGFSGDNDRNKIIWGRDGTTSNLRTNRMGLTGFSDEEVQRNLAFSNNPESKFNNRKGLLAYTRNLINAKGGQIGDTTRKAFKKGDDITAFNGSGLWRAPDNALPRFRGREGIRQHSSVDQYDRFAKAIRFEGNEVYGGNENSVIYKTVMPKLHPILNSEGVVDNRNMMFSIENLAVQVLGEDDPTTNFRIIDDEYGTRIPKCEVGLFGGRVMWFPPYNLEFNESTAANFESTVMVGRNEPVYNYLHSERSATIRFTMLMDYPPQLKNYEGINKHKDIAEFFAFGGDGISYDLPDPDVPRKKIRELPEPTPTTRPYEPEVPSAKITIYFPNDVPDDDEVLTVMDDIHKKYEYEVISGNYLHSNGTFFGSGDGSGENFGLNRGNILLAGVIGVGKENSSKFYLDKARIPPDFSQYTHVPEDGYIRYRESEIGVPLVQQEVFEIIDLDRLLLEAFTEPLNRQALKIVLRGSATRRFFDQTRQAEYNRDLGNRRIASIRHLINERFKVLFGVSIEDAGVEITEDNRGSSDSITTERDTLQAKKERYVEVRVDRSNREVFTERELTSEQQQENTEIGERRQELEDIAESVSRKQECYLNARGSGDDKGILKGFQSASGKYFYPVFHSQTPEDFHRRLTFLQQCMRQGRALKTKPEIGEDGVVRARNSVFGRQPICVLRIGDFFHTKIIIENLTIDYDEAPWDTNPEGFGMQPMIANVTLQIKLMGGQSLRGPINALQNAVAFNHYANSTYVNEGIYRSASYVEGKQYGVANPVRTQDEQSTEEVNKTLENSSRPQPPAPITPQGGFVRPTGGFPPSIR